MRDRFFVPRISFQPSGVSIDVPDGMNIREASLQAGLQIPSTCGGVASCGLCKVKITAGTEHISPMTTEEIGKLGNVFFITKERLACQTVVHGDVSCEVPDDSAERARRAALSKNGLRDRLADRQKLRR
jgi:ferredoxin